MNLTKRLLSVVVGLSLLVNLGMAGMVWAEEFKDEDVGVVEVVDRVGGEVEEGECEGVVGGDEGDDEEEAEVRGGIFISAIGLRDGDEFVEIYNSGREVRVEEIVVMLNSSARLRVGVGAGVFEADSFLTLRQDDFVSWAGNRNFITANGTLVLEVDGEVVDEVCLGTVSGCGASFGFTGSTSGLANSVLVGCFDEEGMRTRCVANAARQFNMVSYEEFGEFRVDGFLADEVENGDVCVGEGCGEGGNLEVVNLCEGLIITEIGANVDRQFVEIHNATGSAVSLAGCRVSVRAGNSWTTMTFGANEVLAAHGYRAVFADEFDLRMTRSPTSTLGNPVRILASSDNYDPVDEVFYGSQRTGTSWALFAEGWKATFVVTPGAENVWSEFQICTGGRVINPLTGNCVNPPAELADCGPGRYRSPETGRCRNIPVSVGLAPCREGYYRNPETNRCRRIAVTTGLADCAPGYYRNPETNRCRRIRENLGAAFGIDAREIEEASRFVGMWGLIGVAGSGVVIAGVQFRRELFGAMRRVVVKVGGR